MGSNVIGAARVVFGGDTEEFERAANEVSTILGSLVHQFRQVEKEFTRIAVGLTAAVTVPFGLMVRSTDKSAGAFEAQMKRVESALLGVSGDNLAALEKQARTLGPKVGKSAQEAAEGIDSLARAGMSVEEILGGGLKQALDLSAAGLTDVSTSAAALTDVMGQFQLSTGELPGVVTSIVGALDESKFAMNDFVDALAQGGGVAAAAGMDFDEFATAIAAVSSQFKSGSDAGTALKTYFGTLTGKSKEALGIMNAMGLSFYDANGRLKSLADQAEMLRAKFGGLSDAQITERLGTLFGQDAIRVAVGLIREGADGIERVQKAVTSGNVEGKIAKALEGSAHASVRIANAWAELKLRFMDAGLLKVLAAIKNAFAAVLETIAKLPTFVFQAGLAFGLLAAAIGPALLAFKGLAMAWVAFKAAKWVAAFGVIGEAIALVISPLTQIVSLIARFGFMAAAAKVLSGIGAVILRMLGPIGLAVTAFLMFRDYVIPVLTQFAATVQATFGPRLAALWDQVQAIFAKVQSGPIGKALTWLSDAFAAALDAMGVALAWFGTKHGQALIVAIDLIVTSLERLVDVVSHVVDMVSALLRGDFAAAWDSAGQAVAANVNGWIDVFAVLLPGIQGPLRAVSASVKAHLVDGFANVAKTMTGTADLLVSSIEAAFPGITEAAKGAYEGLKRYLVDFFGGMAETAGAIVDFLVGKFRELKDEMNLGGDGKRVWWADAAGAAGAKKQPFWMNASLHAKEFGKSGIGRDNASLGGGDDAGGGKGRGGKSAAELAAQREELRLQAQLEAAREREDFATVQRIQDQLDLRRQIAAYEAAGLVTAEARKAAEADMAVVLAARKERAGRELVDLQRSVDIEVARLTGNQALVEALERQEEIQDRIRRIERELVGITDERARKEEATRRAMEAQARIDAARAEQRARWLQEDEMRRQLDLARMRGDSDEEIRRRERVLWIEQRIHELRGQGFSEPEARAKATAEALEGEQARIQGVFRDTVKGGIRAALDGDFKGWFKNWWRDRMAKGMEEALNSVADLIFKLFGSLGGGSGGGGIGAAIGGALGSIGRLFGGGGGSKPGPYDMSLVPGFATGGSLRLGGMGGIDRNLLSLNGRPLARVSRGEMMHIVPANDRGGGRGGIAQIVPSPYFDVVVDGRAAGVAAPMSQMASVAGSTGAQTAMARQRARVIP